MDALIAALKSLFADGKGPIGIGLIIAATVLAALGKMTTAEWSTYSQWVFGIYAGSTALHLGLVGFGGGLPAPTPAPAPAAVIVPAPVATEAAK